MDWSVILGQTISSIITVIGLYLVHKAVVSYRIEINSRMTELLKSKEEGAFARGQQSGGDEARAQAATIKEKSQ